MQEAGQGDLQGGAVGVCKEGVVQGAWHTHYRHTAHNAGTMHTLQAHCTHYRHTAHTTGTLHTLQAHCTHYRHTAHTRGTLHTRQAHCTHDGHTAHTTGTLHTLQAHCTHCRHTAHTTGTLTHYRHTALTTGTLHTIADTWLYYCHLDRWWSLYIAGMCLGTACYCQFDRWSWRSVTRARWPRPSTRECSTRPLDGTQIRPCAHC